MMGYTGLYARVVEKRQARASRPERKGTGKAFDLAARTCIALTASGERASVLAVEKTVAGVLWVWRA
eukprot:2771880-Rhodomonas_salina.1